MSQWEIRAPNLKAVRARFDRAPQIVKDYIKANLFQLGKQIASAERRVLEVVKYTGALARSVSVMYDEAPPIYRIRIGPTAKHAEYILFGTRPHWAPIAPLQRWAKWKLGDEKAAYAVQASIARHGTSVFIERRGLGDGRGGFPFPTRTLQRGDVQQWIARTARRIPLDIKLGIEKG